MIIDKAKFNTQKEYIDFVVKNKASIIAQKRAEIKHSIGLVSMPMTDKENTNKGLSLKANNENEIVVKVAINTTNIIDSHLDVHIPNLWNKSINENSSIMHLQEHQMAFDKIISDGNDLKVDAEDTTFKALGFDYEGTTQALVFESRIKRDRNPFMFEQYQKGYVKEHSVGMQYVKVDVAVNDKDYKKEYDNWKKYIGMVANKEVAEQEGLFFIVLEAKVFEGSAVPLGSNSATPTIEIAQHNDKSLEEIEAEKSLLKKQADELKKKEFLQKLLRNGR